MPTEIELVIDRATMSPGSSTDHHNLSTIISKRSLFSVLTRFHAGYFRISLSLGGQALLWKTLLVQTNHVILSNIVILLWSFALFILVLLSFLYILRCLFRFNLVKAEFLDHVGVNYLFAPWISWLLLLQSAPFASPKNVSYLFILWCIFTLPVVVLDVKIYGQWFTKGKRFLSAVANPTSQISVIGNLVGARAAAQMGWQEVSVVLFSLGMVHYLVLYVTLHQRSPGSDRLPAMLRPVFFLFFAAPSMACLAWDTISGSFDIASKMLFFLPLFLFTSQICRPSLFKKSMRRFNVAWWAYSFPVTSLALAAIEYAEEVKGGVAHVIMLVLSGLSVVVIFGLLVVTALNTKVLLPDDDPILITSLPNQYIFGQEQHDNSFEV